jgi:glycosyltransferase involved in cell wall biosynthesis
MSPGVSVVVPSRGGANRLPLLLGALERQSHDDFEVVVVLDGDVDGSEQVLARWAGRLQVRSVVLSENRGRPAALNAGHQAATGDILVRCDDDLEPGPDYVRRHAEAHQGGPRGVVGMCRNVFPETTYARVYGRPAYERFRDGAHAAPPDTRWRYWGGNVSVDRATWELVGPYDEGYRGYGWEDVDWGYRLHRAGVPIVVVPGLETDHHIAATTTAGRALRAYYSGSARRRFEAKHGFQVLAPGGHDPWNLGVRTAARLLTEGGIGRTGRAVDRVADRLPRALAEKAVALTVEAGSLAGYRRADAGRAI